MCTRGFHARTHALAITDFFELKNTDIVCPVLKTYNKPSKPDWQESYRGDGNIYDGVLYHLNPTCQAYKTA